MNQTRNKGFQTASGAHLQLFFPVVALLMPLVILMVNSETPQETPEKNPRK
jgi:hypothetical protein